MCPTWWLWKFKLCKLIKLQYNLVSAMVPWIKRGHAPQFCDEILNFQCCMTSFSHLVADLLNVDIFPNSGTKWPNSNAVRLVSPTLRLIYILYFGNSATFPDGWNWLCGSQIWIASLLQWLRLLVWITCNCILITSFLQSYLNVDTRLNSVMKYSTSSVVWLVFSLGRRKLIVWITDLSCVFTHWAHGCITPG